MDQPRVKANAELVERARQGDKGAFSTLVRIHQHEVFTVTLRLLGNYELASDAAQETFIRAWRALPRFRGDSALSTWLHRIAVNTSWTLRQRSRRHWGVPIDEAKDVVDQERYGPESAAEQTELRGRLKAAVRELPDPQRVVVVLKDVYGWSHQEIADELGITVTAAKVRLHRARRRLKQRLWEGE